jgi:hypothetical protein
MSRDSKHRSGRPEVNKTASGVNISVPFIEACAALIRNPNTSSQVEEE